MTPEEYERIKEAEKEHLRALKKLKKAVRDLERSKSIANSLTRMGSTSEAALETHQEMVDKLAMETAHHEARLEVALESASEKAQQVEREEELDRMDAVLQKERARSLVENIRNEMKSGIEADTEEAPRAAREEEERSSRDADAPLPEKTIGRMRRGSAEESK
ncbi:MAG: hypothetical protein R3282_04995 [Rhodothermales bacterium]|nr:hypothetical protein [Rhodothermales bacterium]